MFVKICGINSPEALAAAVRAGADAVGFVFAESPREVSPERAKELCAGLPGHVVRIAVMRHPFAERWQRALQVFAPDWLQTDAEDLPAIKLPVSCVALPVYRDGNAPADADLAAAAEAVVAPSVAAALGGLVAGLARPSDVAAVPHETLVEAVLRVDAREAERADRARVGPARLPGW